jgi:hypothetical protein
MQARIVSSEDQRGAIQIELEIGSCHDLVDCEEAIQRALNEAGTLATAEVLKRFDTDGQPIEHKGRRLTTKGQIVKRYETPYGTADVARHIYQAPSGGKTFCPLDERAGIVLSATPKFARMIASKYAEFGSSRVQEDMAENHGRLFSRGYVSNLAEEVAAIAESQSDQTVYRLPELNVPTEKLVVAVDEIDVASLRPSPARLAIGSIGFYDERDIRRYVVYLADFFEVGPPPYLFEPVPRRFLNRLERELQRSREKLIVRGAIVGISGGHPWSTEFLQKCATVQFIDPEKAVDMLSEAAAAYFDQCSIPEGSEVDQRDVPAWRRWEKQRWVEDARDRLFSPDGVAALIGQLETWTQKISHDPGRERITQLIDFLTRECDADRMSYKDPRASHIVAHAGILADSAKVIFGDRIGHPKFKIGLSAARAILILRELTRTSERWTEFWSRTTRKDGSEVRPDS